jgi:hypothetical protein
VSAVRVVLACVLACACCPAVAQGAAATAAQVRALAAAAQRDPAALERLREIDVVDGRPGRLGDALRGSDADLRARLRVLAQAGPARGGAAPPGAARDQARDVLEQRRFQGTNVPSPLRDVRERIGEALRSAGRPFESVFRWLAERVPGGRAVLWVLLATFVLASAALFAGRAGTPREDAGADGASAGDEERMSAAQLRQEAEATSRRRCGCDSARASSSSTPAR